MDKYKTAQNFISKYDIGEKEVKALKNYLVTKKSQLNVEGNERGLAQILRALIGRNLFDKDAYYPILNENDQCILKAVKVFEGNKKV
jgi:hypothetical protein